MNGLDEECLKMMHKTFANDMERFLNDCVFDDEDEKMDEETILYKHLYSRINKTKNLY